LSSTPIPDDIDISEDDTRDSEGVLVKSIMPVQVARYSLVIPIIEDINEHEAIDTSVVTAGKSSEFSRADCDYVVASNFSSSEPVKLFIMIYQITLSVFSFSDCLELFSNFDYIFVGFSNVTLLAVSNVYSPRKPIYLFILSLRVLPSEFVALHLFEMMMRFINI